MRSRLSQRPVSATQAAAAAAPLCPQALGSLEVGGDERARVTRPYSRAFGQIRSYWQLTKPRVVALIVFTAVAGMFLATRGGPGLDLVLYGSAGIWLAAAAAAALNHLLDRRIDTAMARTRRRPLPSGHLTERAALGFALTLATVSMLILTWRVNVLTALLTLGSLVGYSVVYTVWLKHVTPQNIVIGGAAGSAPPVLGWAAVTNHVNTDALLLFLIIFVWTPPHFWSLAIARRDEYAKVGIPMLPVTHGVDFTCNYILLYTILLTFVTTLPYLTGLSGAVYLISATLLNAAFLRRAMALKASRSAGDAMRTFRYSINYLMLLFTFLLADHYWRTH
jgi:heme o synthase